MAPSSALIDQDWSKMLAPLDRISKNVSFEHDAPARPQVPALRIVYAGTLRGHRIGDAKPFAAVAAPWNVKTGHALIPGGAGGGEERGGGGLGGGAGGDGLGGGEIGGVGLGGCGDGGGGDGGGGESGGCGLGGGGL